MCSICGGTSFDYMQNIFLSAKNRGRDYSNLFARGNSWICNHRAVPTTEVQNPSNNQPFGLDYKVVHNGVISNDKELGCKPGEIDSSVLPEVLNFTNLESFAESLNKIKGSYAIAVLKPDGNFYLACNYKPIFYAYDKNNKQFYFSSYEQHLPKELNIKRLQPYSVMDSKTRKTITLPRTIYNHCVVIASGGLDSTAVAAWACKTYTKVTLLHFNYGCIAESQELEKIKEITTYFQQLYPNKEIQLDVVDLPFKFLTGKLFENPDDITNGIEGREYATEWVPARNLMMMGIAVSYAEAKKASYIALGTNLEEGGAYPDNENQFIMDFDKCLYGAVQNGNYVEVMTPVGNLMKHEIVKFGMQYNAPFHLTWSCYRNGDKACGHCGPCFLRKTAFERNGYKDPIEYKED